MSTYKKNADVWNNKGVALVKLRKYKRAIGCFDEAIKIKPDYTEAEKALELVRKAKSEKE